MAKWEYYRIVAEGPQETDPNEIAGAVNDDHVEQIENMANGGWELVLAQPGQEPIVGSVGQSRPVMVLLFRKQRA